MSVAYKTYPVKVSAIVQLTPLIKKFTFTLANGGNFPKFTGGSHVIVQVDNDGKAYNNAYSLMSDPNDLSHYQICVRLDDSGRGGSRYLHEQINVGDRLLIYEPKNLFEIHAEAKKHILIAGGIGITPFIPSLINLAKVQGDYELHYAFRAPEDGALWDELQNSQHAERCFAYISSLGNRLDLSHLIASYDAGTHVYVCGPQRLIDTVIDQCHTLGYPDSQIHFERFSSTSSARGKAFTLHLAKSNQTLEVSENQTILEAIESLGIEVECLCKEGICGTCETRILEGEAEHLDQYLSDAEKNSQTSIMLCVSRAKGKYLSLDV